MSGQLGLGCSTLLIAPRGGDGPALADFGTPALSWSRKLDAVTELRATITDVTHPLLPAVDAWTHEAQIYHDGELAWCGPTWEPTYTGTDVTLPARDLAQWFARRWLPFDRDLDMDLGRIFAQFAADALHLDPSPNIRVHPSVIGVRGQRKVNAADYKRSADQLSELARTAVDWTMLARDMLTGGTAVPLAPVLPVLTAQMVTKPRYVKKGSDAATAWATLGGKHPRTGAQIVGHAHRINPPTGLLQQTSSESGILDTVSANRNAAQQLAHRAFVPHALIVELTPEAPAMSQLVPGARWPVNLTVGCLDVVETLRLTEIRVDQVVSAAGLSNTVTATLASLPTDMSGE